MRPRGAPPRRPRPQRTEAVAGHKLFFALRPDAATAERIARFVVAEHEARGLVPRLRPSHIFHITLHYFGRFDGEPDPRLVALAMQAASALEWPAFDLGFEHFASWGRPGARQHPFVLTGGPSLDGARGLRDALADRLQALGLPVDRDYEPHLTLRYDRHPAPVWDVHLPGWTAREFALVTSPQGLTRHDVLARWPLQG